MDAEYVSWDELRRMVLNAYMAGQSVHVACDVRIVDPETTMGPMDADVVINNNEETGSER